MKTTKSWWVMEKGKYGRPEYRALLHDETQGHIERRRDGNYTEVSRFPTRGEALKEACRLNRWAEANIPL